MYRKCSMLRQLKAIAALALAIACTCPGWADNLIPSKLSVADAIGLALDINPNLKSAEETKRAAQSKLRIVNFNTSLSLDSSTDFTRVPGSSDRTSIISSSLNYANAFGTTAQVDLSPLRLGEKGKALGVTLGQALGKGRGILSPKALALQSAKSDTTIESKQLYISRQATVQGVIEAYHAAVLAREEVKVREQAVKFAEEAADGWRKREAEGMAAGIDVSRSEIQVAQTKDSLNSGQRAARNALDRLMIAIGGGIGQTPELIDSVPTVDDEIPSLADAVKKALANRAELTVADEHLTEQERQLLVAKDQLRPKVDLVAEFNGDRNSEGYLSRSIFGDSLFSTSVQYSLPLDRRAAEEKRDTASRQLEVLRNLRLFQMDQITEEVRSAYRRLESTRSSLEILKQNKTVAQNNLHIANRMMEEGEGSSRDVLDAQQALTEVDSSLLSTNTDLYLATIELKRAMGEDLTQMEFK